MSRLFGFIANRPILGAKLLEAFSRYIEIHSAGPELSWGVGSYQGDEVLLRRRPTSTQHDISAMLLGLRATELVGHVGPVSHGSASTQNTPPFRYRNWLFAVSGCFEGTPELRTRIRASLPEFLRCSVGGDTASELLFYVFLSFLADAGALQKPARPGDVRAALRCSVAMVERFAAEVGIKLPGFSMLLTSGEYLVAVHGHQRMAYLTLEGAAALEAVLGSSAVTSLRIPAIESLRATVLVGDSEYDIPGFVTVPFNTILTIERAGAPGFEPFDLRSSLRVASAA